MLNKVSVFLDKSFFYFVIMIIILRIMISTLPSFQIDMAAWQLWAQKLVNSGPEKFYSPDYFADYFPGYLYILTIIGNIYSIFSPKLYFITQQFEILLKTVTLIFDVATAYFIYKIVLNYSKKLAPISALLYLTNPALIFNSSIWGQVDGVGTFFLISSAYYLIESKKPITFGIINTLANITKPQYAATLPIFYIFLLRRNRLIVSLITILIGVILPVLLSLPFFQKNMLFGLLDLFKKSVDVYPYTSLFAFNLWVLVGVWQKDFLMAFGQSFRTIGMILFALSTFLICIPLILKRNLENKSFYLAASLMVLAFFLFPTRIHERYLFPFFAFFLIACIALKSKFFAIIYIFITIIHLLNLWFVYFYYNYVYNDPTAENFLFGLINSQMKSLSALTIMLFAFLLINYYKINFWKKPK